MMRSSENHGHETGGANSRMPYNTLGDAAESRAGTGLQRRRQGGMEKWRAEIATERFSALSIFGRIVGNPHPERR